jgi:adenylate cyclase
LSSSTPAVDVNSVMKRSQSRVWNTLGGEPGFIISVAETQNVLGKFASSKMKFVILNVDLVGSTKLSMTLPLDRLTKLIQAFNQEMSLIVKEFGGFVLKYVGDAVLAFFVVSSRQSQTKGACSRAINCARCMLQVADNGINPILNQYDCPAMNLRIGIDIGENAIIQSGWDIHPNMNGVEEDSYNNATKKEHLSIKRPFYDILGYSTSIAVKMTTLANPNHMVIGQLVYDVLDDSQKSLFQQLDFSPTIWSYASNNNGENIYNVYTNM